MTSPLIVTPLAIASSRRKPKGALPRASSFVLGLFFWLVFSAPALSAVRTCSVDPTERCWLPGEKLRSKLLADAGGGMIIAWGVIALSQQHPTFSRPEWSEM